MTYSNPSYIFIIILVFLISGNLANASKNETDHWSYEGTLGSQNWDELNEEFILCKEGKYQSPINLDLKLFDKNNPPIIFNYNDFNATKNEHTILVEEKTVKSIEIQGKTSNLLQFHFHAPSEHTIDSKKFAMELHFVHKDENNRIAVIAVFIKQGQSNPFIKNILFEVKKNEKKSNPLDENDLQYLLPENKEYYNYSGSLTTPPCSENVDWYILKNPIEASKEEIKSFYKILKFNARPIQKQRIIKK